MFYVDVYNPPYFQPDVVIEQQQYIIPPPISVEPPYTTLRVERYIRTPTQTIIIDRQRETFYPEQNDIDRW